MRIFAQENALFIFSHNGMNRFLRNSILGLSIALLFPFSLQSKPKDCLILHLKSGSYMIFPLKDLPRITVDNDFFTISSKVFDIENVSKYTFGDSEATGIDELKALSSDGFSMDEAGRVWLASASDDTDIKVYNIEGKQCFVPVSKISSGVCLDFSYLPTGTYLIAVGSETLKLTKK